MGLLLQFGLNNGHLYMGDQITHIILQKYNSFKV